MLKIKAIFLLFLMTVSTIGQAVELHYCKGQITSVSFMGNAECVCPEEVEEEKTSCSHHKEHTEQSVQESNDKDCISKIGCCETEQFSVETDKQFSKSDFSVDPVIVSVLLFNPYLFIEYEQANFDDYNHYPEPYGQRDIPILIQSFLI